VTRGGWRGAGSRDERLAALAAAGLRRPKARARLGRSRPAGPRSGRGGCSQHTLNTGEAERREGLDVRRRSRGAWLRDLTL
jgi:hypothetical protein